MLIIPLRSEAARRSVPWVVIVLMLVNALVFTAQFKDSEKVDNAEAFYRQSVLYSVEPDL